MSEIDSRLRKENEFLNKNMLNYCHAVQNPNNKLEYYIAIRPLDEPYKGGIYLGKLILPPNFPDAPPDFVMITPNGRFELGGKICITNTGYHSEQWTTSWTIQKCIIGISGLWWEDNDRGIRHITLRNKSEEELLKLRNSCRDSALDYNQAHNSEVMKLFKIYFNEDDKGNFSLKSDQEVTDYIKNNNIKKKIIRRRKK